MLRSFAATLLVLGLATAAVPAVAGSLSFTVYAQEKSLWCWAAASKMVIRYVKGTAYTQCWIVQKGLAKTTCPNEAGNITTVMDRVYKAAGMFGGFLMDGFISLVGLRYEIDRYTPIQTRYSYNSNPSGTGHQVVVYGYGGTSTVYWANPSGGVRTSGTYTYLK
jgi:hypothetical protein